MRAASAIFALMAGAYATWDVYLALENGVRTGTYLMAFVALALLVQAFALARRKPSARWPAFASAVAIALVSAAIATGFVLLDPSMDFPAEVWALFGTAIASTLASLVVALCLAVRRWAYAP